MRFVRCDVCTDITIAITTDPDLWVADEQVVQLVAELDELLRRWGLFCGGVHTRIVLGFLWCARQPTMSS